MKVNFSLKRLIIYILLTAAIIGTVYYFTYPGLR